MPRYNAKESEPKWVKFWEDKRIFKFDPNAQGKIFAIDTPPPTVSGKMHVGHAFGYTQHDIVARYKRMRGFNVFYPWGTDDNGLPTERLVEKLKKVKGTKMPRHEFVKLCEETLKEITPDFVKDWKVIGSSIDFSLSYSTIDAHSRRISQWSFLDLLKKKRLYRKDAPTLWCPQCETALAQVECEDAEKPSTFNDIVFKIDGKDVLIATTRPELLPACVAVIAHPEDDRYKHLEGKTAITPLFEAEVPILFDKRVDPSKGTGIVMCCTFGDQTDAEWFRAFNLPLKVAISRNGRMTEIAGDFKDLKVHDARKAILDELKKHGLLQSQKPIIHAVKVHERCGTDIEILKSKQWFIKYLDIRDKMIEWADQMTWYPDFMKHRYINWARGLQWDWLISRQRFFGVAFPVWYCKDCDEPVFASEDQLPVDPMQSSPPVSDCPNCECKEFVPEKDVLDTWATSSLTPKLAIDLLPKEHRDKLFPMDLRPQGHDIITFWLFNTMVKSQLHTGKAPWKSAIINGWVLDPKGKKMSKSKGNVVDPHKVLQKFSADSFRYWAGGSKLGEDFPFKEQALVAGERFVNKLWNSANFMNMHLTGYDFKSEATVALDRWILSRLSKTLEEVERNMDMFAYAHARMAIDQFFWKDLCDNYLELAKDRIYNPKTPKDKTSAQAALAQCLSASVKMMAPFTPFITEEVYHLYLKDREGKDSVHLTSWPKKPECNDHLIEAGEVVKNVIAAVRKKKSEAKVSMKAEVNRLVIDVKELPDEVKRCLDEMIPDLKSAANAKSVEFGKAEEEIAANLNVLVEL